MTARTDLLLQSDGDLPIDAIGLLPTGPSDNQHQRDMFASFPGEWKQFIFNGIGLAGYLKSRSNKLLILQNKSRQQLAADGYNVGKMIITFDSVNSKFLIQTNATR